MDKLEETRDNCKDDLEETTSSGSDENNITKKDKWKDFKKFRNTKKVPKLLHALTVPLNSNPPKQFMNQETTEHVADKQDPKRFFGDGINYKAKLIGIKEVGQARGDKLAQEALLELKASIKASNAHKQKILVNISVDGIKLKDEKGNTVLHHHPVHKISFIAQDISDTRAFGYVFGSPSLGHNFFAIKTEKGAQQVVVAMRDLFQVVFNLRKKEMADKTLSNKTEDNSNKDDENGIEQAVEAVADLNINGVSNSGVETKQDVVDSSAAPDLLDLGDEEETQEAWKACFDGDGENDLFSTPATNDPFFSDPLTFISSISTSMSSASTSFLTVNVSNAKDFAFDTPFTHSSPASSEDNQAPFSTPPPPPPPSTNPFGTPDRYAPLARLSLTPNDTVTMSAPPSEPPPDPPLTDSPPAKLNDIFSDLDPLGKDRPFIHKKDFFYEVKNPPKKVLKDLVEESRHSSSPPSSEGSSCSATSLSNSPPPPFSTIFPDSPFGTTFENPAAKLNGSMDSCFEDEFNLPSPSNPPPPLPAPILPPRPVSMFPPPLPPKRLTPLSTPPVIKLDPPPESNRRSSVDRPNGTLPIPIPARQTRGSPRTPIDQSTGNRLTNPPEISSVSSAASAASMSSVSSMSSGKLSHYPVSFGSDGSWSRPMEICNKSFEGKSPALPPPPPPNSLNTALDNHWHQTSSSMINNNNYHNDNEDVRSKKTSDVQWSMTERSIFHRSSDPFADDFFTSLPEKESDCNLDCRNQINQKNQTWGRNGTFVLSGE